MNEWKEEYTAYSKKQDGLLDWPHLA